MAILKCKMCGGDIQPTDNTYGNCDSCGSTMTLPKPSDDQKVNLFNRANNLRRQNDFDKAATAYENILNLDASSAEAHWGIVLSRYGIEYVEDPTTGRRIPTCRRVQSESILTDADYLSALDNAEDDYTRSLYEEEAKKISEIQKGILAISAKEEPYDVFICYKETSDGGSRTKDSTLAQEIYYQLDKEGYRVFFSRITLEKKVGEQYEPYIFNALNSAKIMLVIGTKPEYFNAVWVKNEWSRFLALMKKDPSRMLIPCYRDMDAYDLPEEMVMLQSQDMSKIGFAQDIIHGIKKVLDNAKGSAGQASAVASSSPAAPGVESLMKRGWLFLEDSDWKQAYEYFNKVLDIDAEYAPAYIGKLCASLKMKKEEELADTAYEKNTVVENKDYQKALRFADTNYRAKLDGYAKAYEEKRKIELELRRAHEESLRLERKKILESILSCWDRTVEENAKRKDDVKLKYYRDYRIWKKSASESRSWSAYWKATGLCPHCGGKLGFFGSCKSCKQSPSTPVKETPPPVKPQIVKDEEDGGGTVPSITVSLSGYDWRVLDVQNDKVLLLSDKIIEKREYTKIDYDKQHKYRFIWEECELRKYLNGLFYNSFDPIVKSLIAETRLSNNENPWHGTRGGNVTTDKVFCLSIEEVVKYFGDSGELKSRESYNEHMSDEYNSARVATNEAGEADCWWLRSPGKYYSCAAFVGSGGSINVAGTIYDKAIQSPLGVRPALWLKLSSEII